MSTDLVPVRSSPVGTLASGNREFVTMMVGGQLFGISVLIVRDVMNTGHIAPIPLAPREVQGALNLRGRIVTAIDVRERLHLERRDKTVKSMSVVVEHKDELYSLIVDSVGEVLSLSLDKFEKNPSNLEPCWREVSAGIYRLRESLLVVLDVERLLDFGKKIRA